MRRPSRGKTIVGVEVSAIKFQGVSTLNELESFGLIRPSKIDKAKGLVEDREKAAHDARHLVQRPFGKARIERAAAYCNYIGMIELRDGMGGVPAITLYSASPGVVTDEGLVLPHNAAITAIDGETQTEARYRLRETDPDTGDTSIAVTIYHGVPQEYAKQILADYNSLGHPMSARETAEMNRTGPLTMAVSEAAHRCSLDPTRINHRGITGTKKHYASYVQLFYGMGGAGSNGAALEHKFSNAKIENMNRPFGPPVPEHVVAAAARLLSDCVEAGSPARVAPTMVWQVAGHLVVEDRRRRLDWANGTTASRVKYEAENQNLAKLRAIAAAL